MSGLPKHVVGAVLLMVALSGCTSSRMVAPTDTSALSTINREAETKTVRVTLIDGAMWQGRALHVDPDSTSWTDLGTERRTAVPTDSVVSIRFTAGRPVRRGAVIGGLAGAITGGVLYRWGSGGEDFALPYTLLLYEVPDTLLGALFGISFEARRVQYQLHPRPDASP